MKRFFVVTSLLLVFCQHSFAQDQAQDQVFSIQTVVDACISLRDAFAVNDHKAMAKSAKLLRGQNTAFFSDLECEDDKRTSLDGHLVFDAEFVREFLKSDKVMDSADKIYDAIKVPQKDAKIAIVGSLIPSLFPDTDMERGQTPDGSILTMTCVVKAGQSTKYVFSSRGHQELAVVAEAGGLVTMKIHVTHRTGFDERFDDTHNVKSGMPHRQVCFDLPEDKLNKVELEVVNCGDKDCSVVIISN